MSILAAIENQERLATGYGSLQEERLDALDRYLGRPYGDEQEGRSAVVMRDVHDTVEWIKPSLMKVFASGDEVCFYALEFSNSASFASGIVQGPGIYLGDAAPTTMGNADTDNGAGRYEFGFTNEFPGGTIYRYVRMNQNFTGTIDTGFNVVAYIVKD